MGEGFGKDDFKMGDKNSSGSWKDSLHGDHTFSVEAGVEFVEIEDMGSSDHLGHVSFVHQWWALKPKMILDLLVFF